MFTMCGCAPSDLTQWQASDGVVFEFFDRCAAWRERTHCQYVSGLSSRRLSTPWPDLQDDTVHTATRRAQPR